MENVISFINSNKDQYVDELKDFLKIPSISTNAANKEDVARCAQYVSDQMNKAGLQNVQIFPTAGHPVVTGNGSAHPASQRFSITDITMCSLWIL